MRMDSMLWGLGRAPWRSVARHILGRAAFDTSRGYENTVTSIIATGSNQAQENALYKGLVEHLVAGEKYIQIVQLLPGERPAVEAWIRAKRKHKNDLTDVFPGVAPESTLIPMRYLDPTAAGFVELENGVAALYTGVRSYVHSVPVPASSLKDGAASGYERIVGYQNIFKQVYDAIWLPSQGNYVVIAVDYPQDGPTQRFPEPGAKYLLSTLRQFLGRSIKFANLWHSVDGLYQAQDGKLVDYGFSAGGQSVNHHKARRRTALCLRKAVYDAAGAAAVTAAGKSLELFKVAMQWSVKHSDGIITVPEVQIPGVAMDLGKALPVVGYCVVRGCLTSRDLSLVVSKLTPHVKNWI